jgi:hypothetical protein
MLPDGGTTRSNSTGPPDHRGDRQLNRALHTIVNWRMIHGHVNALSRPPARRAEVRMAARAVVTGHVVLLGEREHACVALR